MHGGKFDDAADGTRRTAKAHQVAPAWVSAPTTQDTTSTGRPRAWSALTPRVRKFWDAFGLLGPPMVLVVLICIVWTTWLIVLTLAPNETANYLMDTGSFDDGHFWLIVDTNVNIRWLALVGLLVIGANYVYILARMTVLHDEIPSVVSELEVKLLALVGKPWTIFNRHSAFTNWIAAIYELVCSQWDELTCIQGRNRKFWVREGAMGIKTRSYSNLSAGRMCS